ncbi:D-galactonate dehydratase [Colletotrichum siamense]|uniref:D-galactonate dehydratase n=1 Tax=Colletotrichum siamense TaxID=690259 RepID=A0A9P5BQT4_COLSI|nr:D-galactonate dehydratase [Colletotrichum siamense]KAF4848245.1 D-galactonate dehydratase [Colletotrichum siamense]
MTMFAQSIQYVEPQGTSNVSNGMLYFQSAEQELNRETEPATLTSVQALLGCCFYIMTQSRLNHCWSLFGTTSRLVLALGMHRKKFNLDGIGDSTGCLIESECRKRTFWCAYNLDRYLSAIFGRPCAFHDDDIDQEVPALIEDHALGSISVDVASRMAMNIMLGPLAHQQLARILSRILRQLYGISSLDETARHETMARLGAEIQTWRDQLPAFLNPDKVDSRILQPIYQRQSNTLSLAAGHCLMLIYRPCLFNDYAKSSHDKDTKQNVKRCVDAALSVVTIIDYMVESKQLYPSLWFAPYQAFCAVVVLYTYTIRNHKDNQAPWKEHFEAAERCQRLLFSITSPSSLGRRLSVIMEEYRLEVINQVQQSSQSHTSKSISLSETVLEPGATSWLESIGTEDNLFELMDLPNWEQLDSLVLDLGRIIPELDFMGANVFPSQSMKLNMARQEQIISAVEPLHVGQFMFCGITTTEGIIGYGEAGIWGHIEAAATCIKRFAEYLVGKRAFDIEHHWNVVHRFSYFQGLAINAATSSVDIALWDIKGKALGVPIYELLGGACRTKARVYGHIYESTIEKVLEECKRKMDMGFTAFGHINPFLDEGTDKVYFKTHAQKMRDAIENKQSLSATASPKHSRCSLKTRLTRPENADAMARVAERISVPIAKGERFCTIYEFQALLARNALEYARVDVAVCGGITGAKKVAAMAEANHVQIIPHNPLSPIGLAACLQVAAAIPNFATQEYATGFEAGVFESTSRHLGSDIVDYVPTPKEGFVDIPSTPGLGINLVANAQDIRPPLAQPVRMRPHEDGFIVDQ